VIGSSNSTDGGTADVTLTGTGIVYQSATDSERISGTGFSADSSNLPATLNPGQSIDLSWEAPSALLIP
jgi:hypothetical protein